MAGLLNKLKKISTLLLLLPEVCIWVALDDLEAGDLAVGPRVGVLHPHDGVDVGVGLLHHLRQVPHSHGRVELVHLVIREVYVYIGMNISISPHFTFLSLN